MKSYFLLLIITFIQLKFSVFSSKPRDVFDKVPDLSRLHRSRRSGTKYVVEYYMVADVEVYNLVKSRMNGTIQDPEVILRKYYEMTIVNINVALNSLRPRLDISVREAGLKILKKPISGVNPIRDAKRNVSYVFGDSILNAFHHWVVDDVKLPHNDHVVLLTGHQMRSADKLQIFSTGFYNQICSHKSQSVVFMDFDPLFSYYAAHELAISLGAGNKNLNATSVYCSGLFNKVLVYETGKYIWMQHNFGRLKFNDCSYRLIDRKIHRLGGQNCLTKTTVTKITKEPYYGATMSVHEQCNMFTGTNNGGETYSLMKRRESICNDLPCYASIDPRRGTRQIMALTGTPCNNKKWCVRKKCVSDSQAPEIKGKCPFDDDRYFCKGATRGGCYSDQHYLPLHCCHFCDSFSTGIPGCEYGDRYGTDFCASVKKNPSACLRDTYIKGCCKTCNAFRQYIQ